MIFWREVRLAPFHSIMFAAMRGVRGGSPEHLTFGGKNAHVVGVENVGFAEINKFNPYASAEVFVEERNAA